MTGTVICAVYDDIELTTCDSLRMIYPDKLDLKFDLLFCIDTPKI